MDKLELIKYYTKHKPNIISVILFCMEQSYKKQEIYYNGLNNLINVYKTYFPDFVLRLHFDDSVVIPKHSDKYLNEYIIKYWIPLIEKLKHDDRVQLVHYNIPTFKSENKLYHIGTIGQIVRYIPMFDYDNEYLDNMIFMDIDVDLEKEKNSEGHIEYIKEKYDLLQETDGVIYFIAKQCHQRLRHLQKITHQYDDYLFPCANSMIARKKFDHHILDSFLNQVIDVGDNKETKQLINDFNKSLEIRKLVKSEQVTKSKFTYGLDEVCLGYVLHELKKNNEKIYYTNITQIGNMLYHRSKSSHYFSDFNNNKEMIRIFKEIMEKYYNTNKSLAENYAFYDYVMLFMITN